jgi:hypothetical protein
VVTGASRGFGRRIAIAVSQAGVQAGGLPAAAPGWRNRANGRGGFHPGRGRRDRPGGRRPAPRRAPPADPGAQRRSGPAGAAGSPADLADVQPQLGSGRAARVRVGPRGASAAAGAGQRGHRVGRQACAARLSAVRRLCRGQGRHPVHRRLRRRGVRAGKARHQVHLGAPAADPGHRPGGPFAAAYTARLGAGAAACLKGLGPALTPEHAGKAIAGLASGPGRDQDTYLLTTAGLSPVQH